MRFGLAGFVLAVGCNAPVGGVLSQGSESGPSLARSADTGGLDLVATADVCPAGFDDIALVHPEGAKTCVHPTATVLGTYDPGVVIGDGAYIGPHAHLGADATLGTMAHLSTRAQVGAGAEIGAISTVGRGAVIGAGAVLGPDSQIGAPRP